jgi:hypothetical protein
MSVKMTGIEALVKRVSKVLIAAKDGQKKEPLIVSNSETPAHQIQILALSRPNTDLRHVQTNTVAKVESK